jgi:uncharacterized membrane protein
MLTSNNILIFLITIVIFTVIDFIWLGLVAKNIYHDQVGKLLLKKPNLPAALVFYALYAIGVMYFCVLPAMSSHNAYWAQGTGMLFGLFAYGTYDLTNLATLKGWTTKIAILDLSWGVILTGSVAGLSVLVSHAFGL